MLTRPTAALLLTLVASTVAMAETGAPIGYRISIPDPDHRWLEVEMVLDDLAPGPVSLRMARSSPGRYAVHDFAKNVYDVVVTDAGGAPLVVARPNAHEWRVDRHAGAVTVRYRVFGDRVDGTYLGVDATHAHMNIPATLMFVETLADRPSRVTLVQPAGQSWTAATQLFATGDPLVFTAPNLQYLMDSPIEFGDIRVRSFTVPGLAGEGRRTIRVAVHDTDSDAELDALVRDVERIVKAEGAMMGEWPDFEPGHYTFIIDTLPWAHGDGMEHRNSAVITSSRPLGGSARHVLGTVAHEFFHAWNVERIRPRSLEPFQFADANLSGELFVAEGFTSYADGLAMARAGFVKRDDAVRRMFEQAMAVSALPGREVRSVVEMSQQAPFEDGASAVDRTNSARAFISYYTYGAVTAMGLDLSLRARSDGRVGFDTFMRALWTRLGRIAGPHPGHVARPYTLDDLRETLADVAGDRTFADGFFARHVYGREAIDFAPLLARAGYVVRPAAADEATLGFLTLSFGEGTARVTSLVPPSSPAAEAGIELDAEILSVNGRPLSSPAALQAALAGVRPGARVQVRYVLRGDDRTRALATAPNPRTELVSFESLGREVTPAVRAFRESWVP